MNLLLIVLILFVTQNSAYKILCIYPFEGWSHFTMLKAINIALVKHGHQIDVISHYPLEKPMKNYKDIINLSGSRQKHVLNETTLRSDIVKQDFTNSIINIYGNKICELMGHEKMKDFMENLSKFGPYDAVIIEGFFYNCYLAFGYYFNAPTIYGITSFRAPWDDFTSRNPPSLAYSPPYDYIDFANYNFKNFWSRLRTVYRYYKHIYNYYSLTNPQNDVLKKYFGPNVPNIKTLEMNVALSLVNTHFSLYGIRPSLPNVVEIAGIHVLEDTTEITPELKKWMDESVDGVVYFSFGSVIDLSSFSEHILQEFFKSFTKIAPVKVLIKINGYKLTREQLPSNVKILPWIPQIPVLRHNNTKLFITHGGMLGVIEAIYYAVPMIAIPLINDQFKNVYMNLAKSCIIPIEYNHLNEKNLDSALNKILKYPDYKNAVQNISKIFHDRPFNQSQWAVYWIEYVIRNGANSLKSPATDLYWWQNELLDIYLFIITSLSITIYCLFKVSKIILKMKPYSPKKDN